MREAYQYTLQEGWRKKKRNVEYLQKEGLNDDQDPRYGEGCLREMARGYCALRQEGIWMRMDLWPEVTCQRDR